MRKYIYSLLFLTILPLMSSGANVVTLTGNTPFNLGSNEVAEVIAVTGSSQGGVLNFSFNGNTIFVTSQVASDANTLISLLPITVAGPGTIYKGASGLMTLRIRTKDEYLAPFTAPTPAASTAVVIPEDASGPVTVALESSTDLVTWTAANAGTYGSSTTRRFFRVRAIQNQN